MNKETANIVMVLVCNGKTNEALKILEYYYSVGQLTEEEKQLLIDLKKGGKYDKKKKSGN